MDQEVKTSKSVKACLIVLLVLVLVALGLAIGLAIVTDWTPAGRLSLDDDYTLSASQSGSVISIDNTSGFTITLPSLASSAGVSFKFFMRVVGSTTTAITCPDGAKIHGVTYRGTSPVTATYATGNTHTNFIGGSATVGDSLVLTCDSIYWYANGQSAASGGITFS